MTVTVPLNLTSKYTNVSVQVDIPESLYTVHENTSVLKYFAHSGNLKVMSSCKICFEVCFYFKCEHFLFVHIVKQKQTKKFAD